MFDRCLKTESWLAQLGVSREYTESVSYDELESDWNKVNHGRPDLIARVEDAVCSYAEQMAAGSPAPAVILRRHAGRLVVLDGCQRLMANEMTDSRHCAAYIISCNDTTAQKIRIAANQRLNSQAPVSKKWAITQMVRHFIINGSDSVREVATVLGVTSREVQAIEERERVRMRVNAVFQSALKVDAPSFDDGKLDAVAAHSQIEDFEGRAGMFTAKSLDAAFRAKLNNSAFTTFVSEYFSPKRIKAKKRDVQLKSQFDKLVTKDATMQAKLNGSVKRGKLDRVMDTMKQLLTVAKNYKKAAKACPLDDIDLIEQLHAQYREAGRVLRECVSTRVRNTVNHPDGPFCT